MKIKTVLNSLIVTFILLLICFISPSEHLLKFQIAAILGLLFLILGIVLMVLGRKEKGKLKFFVILTGASAIAPLVFTILHNLFYALAIAFENLSFIFEYLHVVSFIIAIVISPISFITGLIGSIILLKRYK